MRVLRPPVMWQRNSFLLSDIDMFVVEMMRKSRNFMELRCRYAPVTPANWSKSPTNHKLDQNLTKSWETHKNACRGLGISQKIRLNYFLSYILREIREKWGAKKGQEMGRNLGLNLICYADEASPRGLPLNLDLNCAPFLDPFLPPISPLSLSIYS